MNLGCRYLEFNKPCLIEVKLSKKEIIGRLKQQVCIFLENFFGSVHSSLQKDDIRGSRPLAAQVTSTPQSQNHKLLTFNQHGVDEIEEISETDARLIREPNPFNNTQRFRSTLL